MAQAVGTAAVERVHPPRWVIKRFVNPVMRKVLLKDHGKMSDDLLLLHFRGRRTGLQYDLPVGYRLIEGRIALFTNSGWRHNFGTPADVVVTVHGVKMTARAETMSDPSSVARVYADLIEEMGIEDASRQLGIKVNVSRTPTFDELRDMAERSNLSIVWVDIASQ